MSVYNARAFLAAAVASVCGQTCGDFEFLIADDCSTDSSREILEEWVERDARIRLYRNDHRQGLTANLERLTALARGAYLARMDADDSSAPERFATQIERMSGEPSIGVLGTWIRTIDHCGEFLQERRIPNDDHYIKCQLRCGINPLTHGSLIFRKDLFSHLERPWWRFRYGQDLDLLLRLSDRTTFGVVEKCLYDFRIHSAGMSGMVYRERKKLIRLILRVHAGEVSGKPISWQDEEAGLLRCCESGADRQRRSMECYLRGRQAQVRGQILQARRELWKAWRLAPGNPKAALMLALCFLPAVCTHFLIGRWRRFLGQREGWR